MAIKILPYKPASASAKDLATALGAKRIKHVGGRYKGLPGDVVINWGSTKPALFNAFRQRVRLLNPPEAIQVSVNKLKTFEKLKEADVQHPEWGTTKEWAEAIIRGGKKVVCRTNLEGYGGAGIVIAETNEELVNAPLYVRYVPKKEEYRVHVMDGEAFFVQRKARKMDVPDDQVNWKIRNLEGGFIYANQNVEAPQEVVNQAIAAVGALNLDFGAVDLIVTDRGKCFTLEVNTACGLAGTTLDKYCEAFRKYI